MKTYYSDKDSIEVIRNLISLDKEALIYWLCKNDPNGIYSDKDSLDEGIELLTRETALEIAISQVIG
jgi:hypothetical protein